MEYATGQAPSEILTSFYADGLIRTFSYKSGSYTSWSFGVVRQGDQIVLNYSQKGQGAWMKSILLVGDGAKVEYFSAAGTTSTDVRRSEENGGTVSYAQKDGNNLFRKFLFSDRQTEYEVVLPGLGCKYTAAANAVVVLRPQCADKSVLLLKQINKGSLQIDWQAANGAPLYTYVIDGRPLKTDPLTAVINELIVSAAGMQIFPIVIFPFIGGFPGH